MNVAIVGYGQRASDLVPNVLTKLKDVNFVSVCDKYPDRAEKAKADLEKYGFSPKAFTDYREALSVGGLDAVLVLSSWDSHCEVALYAMEKGIAVGSEVGCEYSLENCFELVRTHERTKTPYMFMENCCFGEEELLATSLVRRGMLGSIVSCSGAYGHDLRHEIAYGHKNRHYRFDNYKTRCLENYPTHELGPIAKLLNINRGNRIVSVMSVASKAAGLEEYITSRPDADEEMKSTRFSQGDIVETLIKCANGELIRLTLDTTLPRSYSRAFTVRGTKGAYFMDTDSFFFDGDKEFWLPTDFAKEYMGNAKKYEALRPEIWRNVTREDREHGHGGMDLFCYGAFIDALKNNKPMPIDVYDGAVWQAVSVLSEQSILKNSVEIMPDFTHGAYLTRKSEDVVPLF